MSEHLKFLWERYRRVHVAINPDPRTLELIYRAYVFGAKDFNDYAFEKCNPATTPPGEIEKTAYELAEELRKESQRLIFDVLKDRHIRHRFS